MKLENFRLEQTNSLGEITKITNLDSVFLVDSDDNKMSLTEFLNMLAITLNKIDDLEERINGLS